MAVDIVTTINGVDIVVASFTLISAIGQQSLFIPSCPLQLKVVYTAITVTDFDATVDCIRF